MKKRFCVGIPTILVAGCCLVVMMFGFVGGNLQSVGTFPTNTPGPISPVSSPNPTRDIALAFTIAAISALQETAASFYTPTTVPLPTNTPEPTQDPDVCTIENSLVWHATSEMFFHFVLVNLEELVSGGNRYAIMQNANNLATASRNIPHPSCLDQLDENQRDVLWNFYDVAKAMQDGDQSAVDESLYWLQVFMQDFQSEKSRLSAQYGWEESMVNSWKDAKVGMCSDNVLKLHLGDADSGKLADSPFGMLVRWAYPEADLIFVNWEQDGVSCYRVRLIYLH